MLLHDAEDDAAVGRAVGSVVGETTTTGVEATGSVGTGILAEAEAEPSTGPALTDALPETVTPEADVGELVVALEALGALEFSDEAVELAAEESVLVAPASLVALEIIEAIAVEDSAAVDEAMPVDVALVSVVAIETGGVDDAVAAGSLDSSVEDREIGSESTDVGAAISVGRADDDTDVLSALVMPEPVEAELDVAALSVGDGAVETAVGTSLLVETAVGTSVDVVGAAVGAVGVSVDTEVAVDESETDDVLDGVSEVLVLVALEFCDVDDEDAESEAGAVEVATGLDEALLDGTSDVVDSCEDDDEALSVEEDEETFDEGAPDVEASVVGEVDSPAEEFTDEGTEISLDGTCAEEDPAEELCSGEVVTALDALVGAVG